MQVLIILLRKVWISSRYAYAIILSSKIWPELTKPSRTAALYYVHLNNLHRILTFNMGNSVLFSNWIIGILSTKINIFFLKKFKILLVIVWIKSDDVIWINWLPNLSSDSECLTIFYFYEIDIAHQTNIYITHQTNIF